MISTESSLNEYTSMLADQCLSSSGELYDCIVASLEEILKRNINKQDKDFIYYTLCFTGYFMVSGVWSNISNSSLRLDLLNWTKRSLFIKLASIGLSNIDANVQAMRAVNIEFDHFTPFASFYIDDQKNNQAEGIDIDANSTLMSGLEWIQINLGLNDYVMSELVSQLHSANSLPRIVLPLHTLAETMLKAQKANEEKGFFRRLFGGK